MVSNQAEGAVGQHAGADVEVAGVSRSEAQGAGREAVFRDVLVGRRENGLFCVATKGAGGRRVLVGMVAALLAGSCGAERGTGSV